MTEITHATAESLAAKIAGLDLTDDENAALGTLLGAAERADGESPGSAAQPQLDLSKRIQSILSIDPRGVSGLDLGSGREGGGDDHPGSLRTGDHPGEHRSAR